MFSKVGGLGWARFLGMASALLLNVNLEAAPRFEPLVGGVLRPVFVTSPPGDTRRLFIVEQHTGRIRIFNLEAGTLNPGQFLLVSGLATGNEQGLLGLAFHPNYASNGFFYINRTSNSGGRTEIIRYTATGDPANAETASAATAKTILTYAQPESNHNGGWLAFGPDGYLYISSGDGGSGNDPHGPIGNGQSRTTLLGKIMRIDVDGADPYAIPEGNPYQGADSTFREEIWAFGLRNPWRCSFDRETGHLWIGDVGQGAQEEVDVNPAGVGGLNFGWRPYEGTIRTPGISGTELPVTDPVFPVATYGRSLGASITGGYVYRGSRVPEWRGKYIYADYVSSRFWLFTPDMTGTNGSAVEITSQVNPNRTFLTGPSSFGEDANGELYVCSLSQNRVYRLVSDGPSLSAERIESDSFSLTFAAQPGVSYILETKSPLVGNGSWTTLTNLPAVSNSETLTLTNSVTATEQYFRIRVE